MFKCKCQCKESMNHSLQKYLHLRMLSYIFTHTPSMSWATFMPAGLVSLVHANLSWSLFYFFFIFFLDGWNRQDFRLNTRFEGFKSRWPGPRKWVQPSCSDPTMLILKSENSVWKWSEIPAKECLAPWSEPITFERLMLPVRHLCFWSTCISPFCRRGEMNSWRKK